MTTKDNLTIEEIEQFEQQIVKDLESKDFHEVFLSVKEKIEKYPNCYDLIWSMAIMLDVERMEMEIANSEDYDEEILNWYERCLQSEDEDIRTEAATALFYSLLEKEDYFKAISCLDYLSPNNPIRMRYEALIYSKIGKRDEAYSLYEELILDTHQQLQDAINDLRLLYKEDEDHEMVKKWDEVSSSLASALEMGKIHELRGIDVVSWEKDPENTLQFIKDSLNSVDTIFDFQKSKLYQHMEFKTIDDKNLANHFDDMKQNLIDILDDESFDYMQGNEEWEKLKKGIY